MGRSLCGVVLCSPSRWYLAEKSGRPLLELHAQVPFYAARQGAPVDRFTRQLRPGRIAAIPGAAARLAGAVRALPAKMGVPRACPCSDALLAYRQQRRWISPDRPEQPADTNMSPVRGQVPGTIVQPVQREDLWPTGKGGGQYRRPPPTLSDSEALAAFEGRSLGLGRSLPRSKR